MPSADLELVIAQLLDSRTTVSLRAELANSRSEPVAGEQISIDLNLLRSLSHIPSAYGLALTDMVFVPKVREGWRQARGYQQADDAPQRVRLVLDGDSALHALRWELLHDPIDQAPLAYSERVTFSRFLAPVGFHDPTASRKPDLRAVVAVANPSGTAMPPVDVRGEVVRAQTGLGGLHVTVLDGQEGRLRATLPALLDALRQDEPDLLYLVCHGSLDEDGPWLWLEQEEAGSYQPVAGQEFIQAVTRPLRRPLLVILASCQSAGDNYEALASIGPRLAREGIGAVLAMQGRVPQALVAELMPRLFNELRRHGRIDQALAVARSSLTREQPWWIPTLWMAVRDGRLWREVEVEPLGNAYQRLKAMPLDQVPEVAPLPLLHRMPFASNPLFAGRTTDLTALAAALKGQQIVAIGQIAAVTGLGGIGKTSLAVEFTHRYGQFFVGGVLWLSCADPAGIDTEIAACGAAMNLPGFAELKLDDQVHRVKQLWQEPTPRLLIFDNCEDEVLLARLRPTSGGCRMLVTSRRSVWSATLGVKSHTLGVLDRAESIRLLQRFRPTLTTDEADTVAEAVGDLPLALHLVGSYLGRYTSVSAGEYVARLSEALLAHPSLEGRGAEHSPTDHELHVARTFTLSFNLLDNTKPIDTLARSLLARAACLAPAVPIPQTLLVASLSRYSDSNRAPDVLDIDDALHRLLELALLNFEQGAVLIHQLVSAFVRTMFDDETVQEGVEQGLESILAARKDKVGYSQPLDDILPHLRRVADVAYRLERPRAASLATSIGYYLDQVANYDTAQPYFERALAIREQVLGPDHPDTAESLENVGYVLQLRGELAAGQLYFERALAINEKTLGPTHPAMARSLNNVGSILQSRGKLAVAQLYFEQALAINEKVLGSAPYDTIKSLNNLGALLNDMGKLAEAQTYYERALAMSEEELGPNHLYTAIALNNLGHLLQDRGKLSAAQPCFERALSIREQRIGLDHPDTASILNNLGVLLKAQGDLDASHSYIERALIIREQMLGLKHPDTAESFSNLSSVLLDRGELATAQLCSERALAINEQVLGLAHPATATSLNNLGYVLRARGELVAAQQYFEKALTIREQVLGPSHPETANSHNNIGYVLQAQGDLVAAQSYFRQALSIREQVLGLNHPDTALTLNNLGTVLWEQGELLMALEYFEQALVISEQELGDKHPQTVLVETNLDNLVRVVTSLDDDESQ